MTKTALALAMIAIHEIQRPGAKKGKTETITPGTGFDAASESEFDFLKAVGAARPAAPVVEEEPLQLDPNLSTDDLTPPGGDDLTPPGGEDLDDQLAEDLSKKTVKELRAMLTEKEIAFETSDNQAQLIAKLTPAPADDNLV